VRKKTPETGDAYRGKAVKLCGRKKGMKIDAVNCIFQGGRECGGSRFFENIDKYTVSYVLYYIIIILLLLLLTAVGLSPGVSSPTLVQTKIKIHKTTITTKKLQNIKQQNNYKTIKISTQTECITKTHTHTYYKTYEIKTTIADDT
jgi:hypothetical protein